MTDTDNVTEIHGSLDFVPLPRNLMPVVAARSRFFACLAFLLWATVGVLAVERCACEDVASDCEHAGQACARPDDCSDCLVPSAPAALADDPAALLPSSDALSGVLLTGSSFVYVGRRALATTPTFFKPTLSLQRPPAFRAGTLCLRV